MFTIEEILKATSGSLASGEVNQAVSGISTDSRTINPGELFIALEGDNFDGHNFINECFARGAKGVVVKRGKHMFAPFALQDPKAVIVEVDDTTKALGNIAHYHRMRFNIPVIAVTGSNGKTTTKDMLSHILGLKFRVLKNQGTFNNFIGVPITMLKLTCEHQVCVLEMGTNHVGEINYLAGIAKPGISIIANIGPSHLEFFKNLETVAQAKMEIFRDFGKDELAIWNADDGMLTGLYQILNCRKKTFGQAQGCDYRATDIESAPGALGFILNNDKQVRINLLGRHNIYNALAAIAASDALGVGFEDIISGLASFRGPSMRMEILQAGGITIINDSYNSNPKSMESAINVLSGFSVQGRRILVSGDMLELGEVSRYFHNQVGLNVANSEIDIFIAVGEMSKEAVEAAVSAGMNKNCVYHCDDSKSAGKLLLEIAREADVVLIKGSRAMKMENVCSTIYSTR